MLGIPYADHLIMAAACHEAAILTEGHRFDRVRVPVERMQQLPALGSQIPYSHCTIKTTASQQMPIGTEGTSAHVIGMSAQCAQWLPGPHIPHAHTTIAARAH